MKKQYTNKELMLAAGSNNGAHDPEAPDQWRFVLRHAADPLERAMAWVKSLTTAFKHESPFCVDELGKPVYVERLAADMGWKLHTAQNVLGELRDQGRIALKGKRIWYCANVPQAYEEAAGDQEVSGINRRTIGERISSVRRKHGDYVADFIEKLPEEKQIEILNEDDAWIARKREIFSDLMAAGRIQTDPIEDSMFLRWGLPKQRLPKRRAAEVKWVQVKLAIDPSFVQRKESPGTKSLGDFVDARASSPAAATTEVVPRAPVLISKDDSSVGRSSHQQQPTDRPKTASENPYKTKIQEWLEAHVSISGFDLEEAELDQIAATIHTAAHLEQFQTAALRQKNPRGWKVFVTIALKCQSQHGKVMAAGAGSELPKKKDPLVQQMEEEAERRRSWPTR